MNIACVVTAAGLASRFGEDKLMREFRGMPMLEHVLKAVAAAPFSVRVAVVPTADGPVARLAGSYDVTPLVNAHPELGLSQSVRIGTEKVGAHADAILYSVGDQPFLSHETLCRMLALWETDPSRIVALSKNGVRGNPVIFPREFFTALLHLTGDMGGSRIIAEHPDRLTLAEPCDPLELEDIDTKKDWDLLC